MKYVITGSIGHISKAIVEKLKAAGHDVTVITSNNDRVKEIQSLGAQASVGSVEDPEFIKKSFAGADAVYLMIPPKWTVTNWLDYQSKVANNYIDGLKANNIKNVVLLSSMGAHMRKGAGPVDGLGYFEEKLNELKEINSLYLRPSYFFYNLYSMIPLIKNAGIIGSAQGPDFKMVLTATSDIAEVAGDALLNLKFKGQSVQYIASDERSWKDITAVLSNAIGKPGIPYVEFTDEQSLQGMLGAGLGNAIAEGYVAMGKALRTGEMQADYLKNKASASFGKVKLEDFAKEFAMAYNAG
jgi:uncharacterized protein YbjT (DUF2867 family)